MSAPATRNLSAYRGASHRHQITATDGTDPIDWSDRTWTAVLRTADNKTVCLFDVDDTDADTGVLVVTLASTATDRVGRFRWALYGALTGDPTDVAVPLAGEFVLHTSTTTPGDTTEATVVTVATDATTVEVSTWVTSGGGGPSGGAGGVLSGSYPNPGFAVNMATQAELDAAIATCQPLDSDLTAIAALTTTTYGRALLALADAAAGRTALGLGSAATSATSAFDAAGAAAAAQAASQPLDSDLTAIAALTTTTYGRSLLTLADAAAGRTNLGLGTLATQSGTFSGTSSGTNTGDQDLSSYATTSAVAAGYQPLDSDLTAIAALSTTTYGRSLLAAADAAAVFTILGYTPSPYGSVTIAHMVPPTKSGTFGPLPATAANYLSNTNNSASGDYIEWPNVPLGGTYSISFAHHQFANGGQWRVSIDGNNVGSTIEGYAGSTGAATNVDTSIVIAAGLHTVRVTCTGKNASSAGYGLRLLGFGFARTA